VQGASGSNTGDLMSAVPWTFPFHRSPGVARSRTRIALPSRCSASRRCGGGEWLRQLLSADERGAISSITAGEHSAEKSPATTNGEIDDRYFPSRGSLPMRRSLPHVSVRRSCYLFPVSYRARGAVARPRPPVTSPCDVHRNLWRCAAGDHGFTSHWAIRRQELLWGFPTTAATL